MPTVIPFVPQNITVHLGAPDSPAANVTVPFTDYVKNVASSEIYPTWEESALRANILAIVTFALNRVYTEFYRSRGYDFDITNSTQFDQKYIHGRDIYDSVSRIVDELFNDYVTKGNQIQPYFTEYCDGIGIYLITTGRYVTTGKYCIVDSDSFIVKVIPTCVGVGQ